MPDIARFHPQIVHFVVALLFAGVIARVVALTGWLKFMNYGALTLILFGTAAAVLAEESGDQAHPPVERIPGVRPAVQEHEEHGKTTRNVFLGVAALELLAFGLNQKPNLARYGRQALFASAAVGIYGLTQLYEAAEHGGELVYNYAGGPGLRSGDPKDVGRLLLAGLYNQSRVDRKEGHSADAANLVNEMAKRFPADTNVQFLHVESLLLDVKDYAAAQAALDAIPMAATDARYGVRKANMKADIFLARSMPDSARAAIAQAITAFPNNPRLKARLDSLK